MLKLSKALKRNTDLPGRVHIDIQPGPVSTAQKAAWRKFWKIIAEVKTDDTRLVIREPKG